MNPPLWTGRACGWGLAALVGSSCAQAELASVAQRGLGDERAPHLEMQAWQEPSQDGTGARVQEARLILPTPYRRLGVGLALRQRLTATPRMDGSAALDDEVPSTPAARLVWQWRIGGRPEALDADEAARGLRLEFRPQSSAGMTMRGSTVRWQMDASASLALKINGGGARVTWQQAW